MRQGGSEKAGHHLMIMHDQNKDIYANYSPNWISLAGPFHMSCPKRIKGKPIKGKCSIFTQHVFHNRECVALQES